MILEKNTLYIRRWLCISAFMVFAMAVIGAVTRLTESGLSMVEWRPFIGAIPPLNDAEWNRVFDLYKQTPEYIKINHGMGLDEFKNIFFWEWFHRLWGRMIGIIYAVPLAVFWVRGMIPAGYKKSLIGLLILGGVQGVMGYVMVLSGFADAPTVSHYRLAAHLSIAFVIFGWMVWLIHRLSSAGDDKPSTFCRRRHGWVALAMLSVTVIWGAFVAGMDAGLIYNEWPHMGAGRLVPEDMWFLSPTWLNPFENAAAVQFTHRWLAALTLVMVAAFAWRVRAIALGGMVFLQFGLGLATLLTQVAIPIAAMHQAGAFILCALLLGEIYKIRKG
jgi:cytochrome c oxidase assembly protein subunit 15